MSPRETKNESKQHASENKKKERNTSLRGLLTPECDRTTSDLQLDSALNNIQQLITDITQDEDELPFFDAEEDIYYESVTHQNETITPTKKTPAVDELAAIKNCLTDFSRNIAAKLVGQCLEGITQSTGLASLSKKAPELVNALIDIHRDWNKSDSSNCTDRLAKVFSDHADDPQVAEINTVLQALSALLKASNGLQQAAPNYLQIGSAVNQLSTQLSGKVATKYLPASMHTRLKAACDVTEALLKKLDVSQFKTKKVNVSDYVNLLISPEIVEKILSQVLTDSALVETLIEDISSIYNNMELLNALKSDQSSLHKLECMLRLVQERKLGSKLSENISSNLQPVCSALDNSIKLLEIYRDFPATAEISNQITWFSGKIKETPELISWLPESTLTELVADISTFSAGKKTWPKTRTEQAGWLLDSLTSVQAQKYLPQSLEKCMGMMKLAHDIHQEIQSGHLPAGVVSQSLYVLKHANNPAVKAFTEAVIPKSALTKLNEVLDYLKQGQNVLNDIQSYPAHADNSGKAQWAANLLSKPDTQGLLSLIVDKQWLAPLELLRNAQTYPATGSPGDKLRWLLDLAKCAEKNTQLKTFLPTQLNSLISSTQHLLPVLDAYLSLPKTASVAESSKTVASAFSTLFKDYVVAHPELLMMVTKAYPPLEHLGKVLNAYNRVPGGLGAVGFAKALTMEVGKETLGPLGNMWSLGKKVAYMKEGVATLRALNQLRKEWTTNPVSAELRLQQITKPFATSESSQKGAALINHLPALYNIFSQLETKKPGESYKLKDIDPIVSLLKNSKSPLLRNTLADLGEKASKSAAGLITANLDTALLIGTTAVAAKYQGPKTAAAVAIAGGAALWASKAQATTTDGPRENRDINSNNGISTSRISFPNRKRVKEDISGYIQKNLTQYIDNFRNDHSNPGYTGAVINSVKKNIGGLVNDYMKKYEFIYQNRTNPDLKDVINKARDKSDLSDLSDDELWKNRLFYTNILVFLFEGKTFIDGNQVNPPFKEIATDLFSPTPPFETDVTIALREKLNNALHNEIEKYEFSDGGAEVVAAAEKEMELLLNEKINTYTERYLNMHEGVTTADGNKFTTDLSNYAFWHTSEGPKEAAKLLCEEANERINHVFQKAVGNVAPGEFPVKKADVDKAADIFNKLASAIKSIRYEYDLNKLADICITNELKSIAGMKYKDTDIPELRPEQLTPDGEILVGFVGGSKQRMTMRDIGLGRPARIGTVYAFGVQENAAKLSGQKFVQHSAAFDKFLLYLPDRVEAFLTNKVNELGNMISLPTYHELSIKTSLEEFRNKADWSKHSAIYSDAIDKFMRGVEQPELMKVRFIDSSGKKHAAGLAEIIALKGKDGSYLTVSVKNGRCEIIPGDAKKIGERHKEWCLQHMSLYDAGRDPVLKAFQPSEYFDKMTGIYHPLPFPYPIEFSRANDYKQQLAVAFSEKKNSDINTLIKNSHERLIDTVLDWSTLAVSVLAMAIPGTGTAFGAVLQLLSAGVSLGAEIGKFLNSDTVEGEKDAFWGAFTEVLSLGMDLGDSAEIAVKALKKRMAKEIVSESAGAGATASKHIDFAKKSNADEFKPEIYTNKKTINQTGTGDIYQLDDLHTMTDYNMNVFDKGITSSKANNNTIALNRIYGEGTAEVIAHRQGDLVQSLAVKTKNSQKSLDTLLKTGDLDTVTELTQKIKNMDDIEKIADDLANSLRDKGIVLKERGIPISYNKSNSQFELHELDNVKIIPKENGMIKPLTDREVLNLKNDFVTTLSDFRNKVAKQKALGTFWLHKPQKVVMTSDLPQRAIGGTANICRRGKRTPSGICSALNLTKEQLRSYRPVLDNALRSPEIKQFWIDLKRDLKAKGQKMHEPITCLKHIENYYYKMKKKLYRGHTIDAKANLKDIGVRRRASVGEQVTDPDNYLKNIIVHTGGTGTGGKALSFSTDIKQSIEFFSEHADPTKLKKVLLEIDIKDALKKNPDLFMSTPKLLKHYGGYLMSKIGPDGKPLMDMTDLKSVLQNIYCAFKERETFYLGQFTQKGMGWGEIPIDEFALEALDSNYNPIKLTP
ncbi:hypothetical protein [Pantoea sp. App145]|uniref:hypothetical protein n=1 Tax=Pantoea sp. App145 TaxID=3071567 RepID=UPI003A808ED4